jgi:hypothetical protein
MFPSCKPLKPVLFKCHWFDPDQTQETKDVGVTPAFLAPNKSSNKSRVISKMSG